MASGSLQAIVRKMLVETACIAVKKLLKRQGSQIPEKPIIFIQDLEVATELPRIARQHAVSVTARNPIKRLLSGTRTKE